MSKTDPYGDLANTSSSVARRQEFAKTIKKEILLNAIQHPATLLPLTTSVLALIFLQFFSQRFGGSGWAMIALFASGIVAIGSFFWQYVIRFPDTFAQKAHELQERQEQQQIAKAQEALQKLQEQVHQGFTTINFSQGLKALRDLNYEYQQLQSAIDQNQRVEYVSLTDIRELTEKTYRQGLSVLADAVDLGQVIYSMNKSKLEREIRKLEREIALLERDSRRADQANIKKATLKSHKERLSLITQQQIRMEKLLSQCDRCEASLQKTRLELAAIKTQSSGTDVETVTDTLQQTIEQAKAVQSELKNLGF
jgi:hypothetical protein